MEKSLDGFKKLLAARSVPHDVQVEILAYLSAEPKASESAETETAPVAAAGNLAA